MIVSSAGPRWNDRYSILCMKIQTGDLCAGYMRYELLRTLNVSEFAEIWKQNLHGEKFDVLVDLWIEERLEKEELRRTQVCGVLSMEHERERIVEHVCGLPATHQAKNHVLMCDHHAEQYRAAFRYDPRPIGKAAK